MEVTFPLMYEEERERESDVCSVSVCKDEEEEGGEVEAG